MASGSPGKPVVDPLALIGTGSQLQVPHNFTKKANSKEIIIGAEIVTATNKYTTLEQPKGTDYSVPTGKELLIFDVLAQAGKVTTPMNIGYGDTGVSEGTVAPDATVFPPGFNTTATVSVLHLTTIDVPQHISVSIIVPADKFPVLIAIDTATAGSVVCTGVEYDA